MPVAIPTVRRRNLPSDEINMVVPGGENQSCMLSSLDDETYQYVVMPMRI